MKRFNLFGKTFIVTLLLILITTMTAYIIVYLLMPPFYERYKISKMDNMVQELNTRTEDLSEEEAKEIIVDFAISNGVSLKVTDADGRVYIEVNKSNSFNYLFSENQSNIESNTPLIENDSKIEEYKSDFDYAYHAKEDNEMILEYAFLVNNISMEANVGITLQPLTEAKSVLVTIYPIALIFSMILAFVISWLYAKHISSPIIIMSKAARAMSLLQFDADIYINRYDETAILADDINIMYKNLKDTINQLQYSLKKAETSENQKVDFFRAVSHEFKTPLTSVNAVLEGMIYNIPPYNNHEKYLMECKSIIERASEMVKGTLDLSRNETEATTEIDLQEQLEDVLKPYRILMKSKDIKLLVNIAKSVKITTKELLLRTALSNILSNAVNHTPAKGEIMIDLNDEYLSVNNSCMPLSDEQIQKAFMPFSTLNIQKEKDCKGNGLGLYIIERNLTLCGLKFVFTASQDKSGMSFKIHL